MIPVFANNVGSTLVGALTTTSTSLTVQSADAPSFPQLAAGQYFMVTLLDMTQTPAVSEICQCTEISGGLLTIVRAQEGTTAQAFPVGASVTCRLTAGVLSYIISQLSSNQPTYIGAYASAPTTMPNGTTLVPGTLYFNTTSNTMFEWSVAGTWNAISTGGSTGTGSLYLGQFASAPTVGPGGVPLVIGDLYWNTVTQQLYVYQSGWQLTTNVNYINGNLTVNGNVLISGNLGVTGNVTIGGTLDVAGLATFDNVDVTGTLTLDGLPVVAADQLSGTANSQQFPDGTVLQWGLGTYGTAVEFPIPYTTTCDYVQATPIDPPNQGTSFVHAATLTGFTPLFEISGGGFDTGQFYWLASGK